MGRSTGQSWEEGNWGWSSFHLSWVPGSRESGKLIFAALEPRPRSRLRIKGFWGGVSIHSRPAARSTSRPGDGGFRRGLYLPPRIPGYHEGGGGRIGYHRAAPHPLVLRPSHPAAPLSLEPPGCPARCARGAARARGLRGVSGNGTHLPSSGQAPRPPPPAAP